MKKGVLVTGEVVDDLRTVGVVWQIETDDPTTEDFLKVIRKGAAKLADANKKEQE